MTRPPRLPAAIAAWLLLSASTSFAASAPLAEQALAPLASAYMEAVTPGEQADLHRGLFETVLQRVQRSYARDVDLATLVAAALKTIKTLQAQSTEPAVAFKKAMNAALATLDPHSRYLDPLEQRNERSSISGSFGGLGIQVDMVDGLIRIVAPMPDTPAARAGLKSGDLIVRFDDQPVQGMALTDAISKMRGEPGTPIALMVRRAGQADEFRVSLVREVIRSQVLHSSMEGDVLVLRLTRFAGPVSAAIEKAIADASAERQPRGVILDMRGNGGGLFHQAVRTADVFLSEGEIVSVRGRNAANRRSWQADPVALLGDVPMVVLIDGRSASAAELVAAALQENGRATVMGSRSFGKGSVQSIMSLGEGKGALRLTTAIYHGPSGRTVQRTGVTPDIELVAAPETASTPRRRESDRPQALPGADEAPPPKARIEQSRCSPAQAKDPVLACALAFLEAGAIDSFLTTFNQAQ